MIGLPSSGTGANISTGQGQGAAQVLSVSSFDPIEFMKGMNEYREKKALAEQKKQLERQAKWAKVGTPDVKYVTDYNRQELEDAVNKYSQFVTEGFKQGIDPEYDANFKKELQKIQMGILKTEEASRTIDDFVKKYAVEKDKYDPEQWKEWMEGLSQQPTVQDRLNYVQSKQPYTELINPVELLGDIINPENLLDITQKRLGNGVVATTEAVSPDDLKSLLETSLYGNSAYKNKLAQYMTQEGIETADELENKLFGVAQTLVPKPKTTATVGWKPSGGGLNINFGGGNPQAGAAMVVAGGQQKIVSSSGKVKDTNVNSAQLPKLGETLEGVNKIKNTVLKGTDIGAGVFNIVYDENKQLQNGNFLTVEGGSLTGRPNALKFTQDGSLWAVLGNDVVPIQVNTNIIKEKDVVANAKANYDALRASFGADTEAFNELIRQVYATKDKKGTTSTTTLTTGSLDDI